MCLKNSTCMFPMAADHDPSGIQLIDRISDVLEFLGASPAGASLGQIAHATGLPRSTIQRLVRALNDRGLVVAGADGVRLGPTLARLAAAPHVDVLHVARPFMEAAGRRCRETVDLSIWRGTHVLLVGQVPCDQELRVISPVGSALPSHCTAHGKALLSAATPRELDLLMDTPLPVLTPHTLSTRSALFDALSAIQLNGGIAIDKEEHVLGVCGIGIALACPGPERYALSIAAPAFRFHERQTELRASLVRCKAEIEAAMSR
jgi:IclR family transcriptional regulator, acetate operon repressor